MNFTNCAQKPKKPLLRSQKWISESSNQIKEPAVSNQPIGNGFQKIKSKIDHRSSQNRSPANSSQQFLHQELQSAISTETTGTATTQQFVIGQEGGGGCYDEFKSIGRKEYPTFSQAKTIIENQSGSMESICIKQQNIYIYIQKPKIENADFQQRALPKPQSVTKLERSFIVQHKTRSYQSLHSEVPEPNQFTLRHSMRTKKGVLITKPGKVNQDVCICVPNLGRNLQLFGVCDGHGQNGHLVSGFIKQNLPNLLNDDPKLMDNTRMALVKSINAVANSVNKTNFDTQFSGSTLNVMIVVNGSTLICANVGDSRTILGRVIQDGRRKFMKPVQITIDHKPSIPRERLRIHEQGGRVDSYYDQYGGPIGPQRVWVGNNNYPGLAMSRSLGDQVAASVGVSPRPDIFVHTLESHDKFCLMASDGVWEFLSNNEIVRAITPFYVSDDIEGACDEVMRISYESWTRDDNSVVDDISFVLIFFR